MKKIAFAEGRNVREPIDLNQITWPISFWSKVLRVPLDFGLSNDDTKDKIGLLVKYLHIFINAFFFFLCLVVNILTFKSKPFGDSNSVTGSWNETITSTNYFIRITFTHLSLLMASCVQWPNLSSILHEAAKQKPSMSGALKKRLFSISLIGCFAMLLVKAPVPIIFCYAV